MKLRGTVYLALKIYLFPFSSLTNNDFHITIQGRKKSFVTIAEERSIDKHTLLHRIKDAING